MKIRSVVTADNWALSIRGFQTDFMILTFQPFLLISLPFSFFSFSSSTDNVNYRSIRTVRSVKYSLTLDLAVQNVSCNKFYWELCDQLNILHFELHDSKLHYWIATVRPVGQLFLYSLDRKMIHEHEPRSGSVSWQRTKSWASWLLMASNDAQSSRSSSTTEYLLSECQKGHKESQN